MKKFIDTEQIDMLKESIGDPFEAKQFFFNIIELFQTDVGEVLDQMEKFQEGSIIETEIRKNIHFIAGAAANVGLARLAFNCREYESSMIDELPFDQSIGEIISDLQKNFRDSVQAYHEMIDQI